MGAADHCSALFSKCKRLYHASLGSLGFHFFLFITISDFVIITIISIFYFVSIIKIFLSQPTQISGFCLFVCLLFFSDFSPLPTCGETLRGSCQLGLKHKMCWAVTQEQTGWSLCPAQKVPLKGCHLHLSLCTSSRSLKKLQNLVATSSWHCLWPHRAGHLLSFSAHGTAWIEPVPLELNPKGKVPVCTQESWMLRPGQKACVTPWCWQDRQNPWNANAFGAAAHTRDRDRPGWDFGTPLNTDVIAHATFNNTNRTNSKNNFRYELQAPWIQNQSFSVLQQAGMCLLPPLQREQQAILALKCLKASFSPWWFNSTLCWKTPQDLCINQTSCLGDIFISRAIKWHCLLMDFWPSES